MKNFGPITEIVMRSGLEAKAGMTDDQLWSNAVREHNTVRSYGTVSKDPFGKQPGSLLWFFDEGKSLSIKTVARTCLTEFLKSWQQLPSDPLSSIPRFRRVN